MKKTLRLRWAYSALLFFACLVFSLGAEAQTLSVSAASMTLSNYKAFDTTDIQLTNTSSPGTATTSFTGSTGTYTIAMSVSETTSTGGDKYALLVNGATVGTYTNPAAPASGSWTNNVVFKNISIAKGNTIEVQGTSHSHSLAQVNSLTFTLTSSSAASCTFNGSTVASGSSVTAYLASSVASGSTCSSQTRTCANGTLSGTYTYASCSVAAATTNSFTASPNPVAPGSTITFTGNINAGVTATNVKVDLWIFNSAGTQVGVAAGLGYNFTAGQTTPVTLTFAVPSTLAAGTYTYNLNFYQASNGAALAGAANKSNDGSFTVGASTSTAASCTFNGSTVASGSSVTAYQASTAPSGQTCTSQTRTCTNGTLSGTYAYSSCTSSMPSVSSGIKWHPGHYLWLDPNTSQADQFAVMDSVSNDANIKGFQVFINWGTLEGNEGDYSAGFAVVDSYLAHMATLNTPKRLMLGVVERKFGTAPAAGTPCTTAAKGMLPDYINEANECSIAAPNSAGSLAVMANFWEAPVMDRLIALSEAYAARYDSNPMFELFLGNGETAVAAPSGSGFSSGAYITQLERWFDASKPAWAHTQLRLAANYLGSDADLLGLISYVTAGGGVIVGGPDPEAYNTTTGAVRTVQANELFRNASGTGTDFRPTTPWIGEVQGLGMGATGYPVDTPAEVFTGTYGEYNVMNASYMVWVYNTYMGTAAEMWSTGELPYIDSINGETHTACPKIYTQGCNTQ